MASPRTLDQVTRGVRFAVELVDPVTLERVWRRIEVEPRDVADRPLTGKPVVNASGRFVWLDPVVSPAALKALDAREAWPAKVAVTPRGSPYAPQVVTTPLPLADPLNPGGPVGDPTTPAGHGGSLRPHLRLIRIHLSPTPAHPMVGATALRERLLLTAPPNPAPLKNALVQLAWWDGASWIPATAPAAGAALQPGEAVTDERGEFAVFLPPSASGYDGGTKDGKVDVRLQVTRRDLPGGPVTRLSQQLSIREGRLATPDVRFGWDELN